jgi:uncharacterized glyoxalase superfamily protein PhnB
MLSPILSVMDIDASIEAYTRQLGFTLAWRLTDDDDKATFAAVRLGEAEILLGTIEFVAPEDRSRCGIGVQLYIELPADMDVDALFEQARDGGANIIRDLKDRDWGVRAFNVRDPDGYELMLARPLR